MGTWGAGILQNDSAQDGLIEAATEIVREVAALAEVTDERAWPRLLGSLGLLVQFSPYNLRVDSPSFATLQRAIDVHRPNMTGLSSELLAILDALEAGAEPEYDVIRFPPELERALHGPKASPFQMPMQKTWARAPAGCFDAPGAAALLQDFADRRLAKVEEEFACAAALADLCREGFAVADFALLLILEPIRVDPARFMVWREAWRRGREEPDPSEAEFYAEYNACLERAFAYGTARFSV